MEKEGALPVAPTGQEQHEMILQELCRICGNRCTTNENEQTKKKILPHAEIYPLIKTKYAVDFSTDQKSRHPPYLCYSCFWKLLYEKQLSQETPVQLASWTEHTGNCGICLQYKIQRKRRETSNLEGHTPVKKQKTQQDDNQPTDQFKESGTEETKKTPTVSAPHPVEFQFSISRNDAAKRTKPDPLRKPDVSLKGRTQSVGVVVSRSKNQTQGDPEQTENDYFIIPTSSKQDSTNNAEVIFTDTNSKGKLSFVSPSVSSLQETSPVVITSRLSNSNQSTARSDEVIAFPTPSSNNIMQAAALVSNTPQSTTPTSNTPQSTTPTPNKTAQLTAPTPNKLTTPTSNKAPQSTTPTPNKTAQLTSSTPNKLTTPTSNKGPQSTTPTPNKTAQLTTPPNKLTTPTSNKTPQSTTPTPNKTAQLTTPNKLTTPTSNKAPQSTTPTPNEPAKLTTPTSNKAPQSTTPTPNEPAKVTTPTTKEITLSPLSLPTYTLAPSNTTLLTTPHGTAQLTTPTHKTANMTTPTPSNTTLMTTPHGTAQLTTPTSSKTKQTTTCTTKKTAKLTTPTPSNSMQLTTPIPSTIVHLTAPTCKPFKTWRNPLSKNKSLQYAIPKSFQLNTTSPDKTNKAPRKVLIRWVAPPAGKPSSESSNTPAPNKSTTAPNNSTPAPKKTIQLNPFATGKTSNKRTIQPSTAAPNATNQEVQQDLPDEFLKLILQRPLIAPLSKKMEKIATHLFQTKLKQSGGMTTDFQTDDENLTALLVPGKHKVNTRKAIGTAVESQKKFIKHVTRIIGELDEQASPLCRNCVKKDQLINKYRIALYEEKKRRKKERYLKSLLAVGDAEPAEASQGTSSSPGPASSSKPATDTKTNNTSSRRERRTRSYIS